MTNEVSFKEFLALFAGKYRTISVCLLLAWLIVFGAIYIALKEAYSFLEIALGWAALCLVALYLGSKSNYEECTGG